MKTPEETVMKNHKGFSQKNRSFLSLELESSISRNIRKFRYVRVLNIPFLKYKKAPLYQDSEHTFPEI